MLQMSDSWVLFLNRFEHSEKMKFFRVIPADGYSN